MPELLGINSGSQRRISRCTDNNKNIQKMKFAIEHISSSGARVGRLSALRSQPDHVYETPLCLISTQGGSVPHLTQDVVHMVTSKEAILSHSAQQLCQQTKTLQAFKKGLNSFAGLPSHGSHLSVQYSSKETPPGYNDKKGISVWSYSGRQQLDAKRYMELVAAVRPDWFEALSDADTDAESSKKRRFKSMESSTNLLQQCQDMRKERMDLNSVPIFAPLLGGYNIEDRKRWSQAIAEKTDVHGYTLLGLVTHRYPMENHAYAARTTIATGKGHNNECCHCYTIIINSCWSALNILSIFFAVELCISVLSLSFILLPFTPSGCIVLVSSIFDDQIQPKMRKFKNIIFEGFSENKEKEHSGVTCVTVRDKLFVVEKAGFLPGYVCDQIVTFRWPPFFLKDLGVGKEIIAFLNNFIQNSRHRIKFFNGVYESQITAATTSKYQIELSNFIKKNDVL
ncbi:unnamed protein product, partial [Meganyctiphanes norvegica]